MLNGNGMSKKNIRFPPTKSLFFYYFTLSFFVFLCALAP